MDDGPSAETQPGTRHYVLGVSEKDSVCTTLIRNSCWNEKAKLRNRRLRET